MMSAIMRPRKITLIGSQYFNADDLKLFDPVFFFGCSKTSRLIIRKKSITSDQYMYASWSKIKGWTISPDKDKPSNKAKLLLCYDWVLQNMPKMNPGSIEPVVTETPVEPVITEAPPLLHLEEREKFTNDNGVAFNIETRGARDAKSVYFLASDVSVAFAMPSLVKTMTDKDVYITGEHYESFIRLNIPNRDVQPEKRMFITYKGMLKILFSSRVGNAGKFVDWATETLFVSQMGTDAHREELSATVLGVPVKNLRQVLKANAATAVPCIYLFALGTAAELRTKLNLPDTMSDSHIIAKWGRTEDLDRRTGEHQNKYEKITGQPIQLLHYVYVDPKYTSESECDIKDFFKSIETPVDFESFAELVAIDPRHLATIKKQFKYLHVEYAGAVKDLIEKIETLKREAITAATAMSHLRESSAIEIAHLKEVHQLKQDKSDTIIDNMSLKNELLALKLSNALNR